MKEGDLVLGLRAWRLVAPLGQGGGGTVWLAQGPSGEQAALKFFPRMRGSFEELVREGAATSVRHPAFARLLDAGVTEDGLPWLAVERVVGEDLRNHLERESFAPDEALRIGTEVMAALDALHRMGLAHGDVKPENILLEADGRVRIIDFGRAWLVHRYGNAGVYPGTPPYMHPSLFHGGTPDARTDIFATWVMVYELIAGERPFSSMELKSPQLPLQPRRPLPDEAVYRLVLAGLRDELVPARIGQIAMLRFRRGRTDLPRARNFQLPLDSEAVDRSWAEVVRGRSAAVVGDGEVARGVIEEVHRHAEAMQTRVLWARADWGNVATPLSGALSAVEHAADSFDLPTLRRIAEELGPLGGVLASRLPAVRTWVHGTARLAGMRERPASALELELAVRTFIGACPRPLLLLLDRVDGMDGSSRRLFGRLVAEGAVHALATAAPGDAHGMPTEIRVQPRFASIDPQAPHDPAHAELLGRASVLGLPFGALLARAAGVEDEVVAEAALECEARGSARWNGAEVLPRPVTPTPERTARRWLREGARRLDVASWPLLVASWARRGGDSERLAEAIEPAVAEAVGRDPAEALRLLDEDARPRNAARVHRHFRVALLARERERAEALLAELRLQADVGDADLAEAEGELAFRGGAVVASLGAYRRAAAALGRPVKEGLLGTFEALRAIVRLRAGRRLPPAPDERLGRIFERLHDLQFTNRQGPMLRIHELWLRHAPRSVRARAMDIVWLTALGQEERALALEEALLADCDAEGDHIAAAIVLLHRAIARSWRGDTLASHADALQAGQVLRRSGDPYLLYLAVSTLAVTSFHLGKPEPLAQLVGELQRLAAATGDTRGEAWVAGSEAMVAWLQGEHERAVQRASVWAESALARQDSTEGLARRFLADLHLEVGDHEAARRSLALVRACVARYGLRMEFVDAWVIGELVADAQARLAGGRPLGGLRRWWLLRKLEQLAGRSPRWLPRVLVAKGWQAAAAGDRAAAASAFDAALTEARQRRQAHDEWWVLHTRARVLGDEGAAAEAERLATRAGLKLAAPRLPLEPSSPSLPRPALAAPGADR